MADTNQAMGTLVNAPVDITVTPVSIGTEEYAQALEWLYREARLLDQGDFETWLSLMADDIAYNMPTRSSVLAQDGTGFDFELGLFAENHSSLTARVKRLQTDQAWAERPQSRTRHFISNVLVNRNAAAELQVTAAFLITRLRSNRPVDLFCGERQDVLRRREGALKLVRRTILLDQTVLASHNLSIFF